MKSLRCVAGVAMAVGLMVSPVWAQDAAKKKEPPKPASSPSQAVLEQWNDIGRKIIAIAEDLPEDFTDPAQGQKPRYPDDPKRDNLKTKAEVVAFVKKCVQDGADLIKAKGDKGMSETVNDGGPRLVRISDLAYGLNEHTGEHYGQLVVYYRINAMVPPESRPKK